MTTIRDQHGKAPGHFLSLKRPETFRTLTMILETNPEARGTKGTRMVERGEGVNCQCSWLVPPWVECYDPWPIPAWCHKRFGGKKTHGNNWLSVMAPWMVPPWGNTGARSREEERLTEKAPWTVPPWHHPTMWAHGCDELTETTPWTVLTWRLTTMRE